MERRLDREASSAKKHAENACRSGESKRPTIGLKETPIRSSSPIAESGSRVAEIAELLALGYLRARKRQVDRDAKRRRALSPLNPLDDVAPGGKFATGDRRTSETGGERG